MAITVDDQTPYRPTGKTSSKSKTAGETVWDAIRKAADAARAEAGVPSKPAPKLPTASPLAPSPSAAPSAPSPLITPLPSSAPDMVLPTSAPGVVLPLSSKTPAVEAPEPVNPNWLMQAVAAPKPTPAELAEKEPKPERTRRVTKDFSAPVSAVRRAREKIREEGGYGLWKAELPVPTNRQDLVGDFGPRTHPVNGGYSNHTGSDMSMAEGTPVSAPSGGVVKDILANDPVYGNMVIIDHGGGEETRYAHLASAGVQPGQVVKRGDLLGQVGNTGLSTGPHLHWETRRGGQPVDPATMVDRKIPGEVLKQAILDELDASKKAVPTDSPRDRAKVSEAITKDSDRFERINLRKLTPFAAPVKRTIPGTKTQAQDVSAGLPAPWNAVSLNRAQGIMDVVNSAPAPEYDIPEPWASAAQGWRAPNVDAGDPGKAAAGTEDRVVEEPGKTRTRRSFEMTWEDYNKLSSEQRAAVDFNTLLVEAREKDLNAEDTSTPAEKEAYDAKMEEIFGEGAGSETYAPETLAVLEQLEFKANGEDLDDFLSLRRTFSEEDIKTIDLKPEQLPITRPGASAEFKSLFQEYDVMDQLAMKTENLREEMAKSNKMLQTFRATAAMDRESIVNDLGGQADRPWAAFGYGTADIRKQDSKKEIDEYFQLRFSDLAYEDFTPEKMGEWWSELEEKLRPKEREAFLRYADNVTRTMVETNQEFGKKGFRPPAEVRALLGLPKVGA